MTALEFIATGSGASIVGFLINEAKEYRKKRQYKIKQNSFLEGMKSVSKVYAAMEEIKDNTPADQVLLLEVANGGDNPKPGSIMYARAIEAKNSSPREEKKIVRRYESLRIDNAYINMVIQTMNTGLPYIFKTDSHADCLLKTIYTAEEIKYSEVYHIHTDVTPKKVKVFILAISTPNHGLEMTDAARAAAVLNIERIKLEFAHFSSYIR